MGKRTSYPPGTFCWVDLATTDVEGAKHFYGELLGWTFEDRPANGSVYSVASRYDAHVAGVFEQRSEERAGGLPPHWNSYVSTDSADRTAARTKELGGSVLAEPFDAMQTGRLTVLADPGGAVLCAWQPRGHIGAGHVNDPGCLTWNDLTTKDAGRAEVFYSDLFGWRFARIDTGGGPAYWVIGHDGASQGRNGGMRELSPDEAHAGVPPNWMPYFTVESVDAALGKAQDSGGHLLFGPNTVPAGRFAVLSDPERAAFAVFEGDVDD